MSEAVISRTGPDPAPVPRRPRTDISGVDLGPAAGLALTQLTNARRDAHTLLPHYLFTPEVRPTSHQ